VRGTALTAVTGGIKNVSCAERSQLVPACPSGKGRLWRDGRWTVGRGREEGFVFLCLQVGKASLGAKFEVNWGGGGVLHAAQRAFWIPTEHVL
jgi:hypothetical protein